MLIHVLCVNLFQVSLIIMTDVQVKIELGHRATPRTKPTKEGHTHDWTVYVRGPEQYNISNFVEKVVFNLHPTFTNAKRGIIYLIKFIMCDNFLFYINYNNYLIQ